MIRSFRDKGTECLFSRRYSQRFPPDVQRTAWRKLAMLDAAENLNDLRAPPGNRLEELKGDLDGYHSIRVNEQWRIVFRWDGGDAHEVRLVDYH